MSRSFEVLKTLVPLIAGTFLCGLPASSQIGTITNVGKTTANLDAIAFRSTGTLYGGTSGAGSLYTIDPASGAVTLVHALVGVSDPSLTYGVTGLAFQPGTDVLYGSTSPDSPNSGNSLVTINVATGQVTVIGPTGTGRPYTDIAFAPNGTLYGWLIGSGATTISAATINLSTGAGTSLGSPQTPAAAPDGGGLAISSNGVIYVAANGHLAAPCTPTTNCTGAFWTINPANGAPTTIGTLTGGPGSAPTITALAFSSTGILYGIEGGDGGASWNLVTIKAGSQPATPVSVSPPSGSSASQTLQFTFTDPRGVRDLDVVNVLINNFLDARNACYLAYSVTAGALYLVADDGSTLLPVNSPSAVANSQCSVSASGNGSSSGNDLSGSLTFNFTPAFAGNKVIYMAARDLQGGNSGWQALGTWQVPGFSTFPSAVSIDQPHTSGSSQSLPLLSSIRKARRISAS